MPSDRELLTEFTRSRSEAAFRSLVERHLDLVHSVARRVTLNDDLARDVAQAVFLRLATRPDKVPRDLKLLAWLHRTTRHKAIDLVRSENRRRRREQLASQQQKVEMESHEPALDWGAIEPVIDRALENLPAGDRSLILSRYYRKDSHAKTARDLGISEDAARMRTRRALGKLRGILGKRGIATTSTLLATLVSTNAVTPAPASLAASLSSNTLAVAESASASTPLFAFLKAHLATVAILTFALPIIVLQTSQGTRLREQAKQMRGTGPQIAQPAPVTPEHDLRRANREPSLEEILAIADPLDRLRSLIKFANRVHPSDIPSTVLALRLNTPEWDQEAKITAQLLFTRWAKDDVHSALHHLENLDYQLALGDMTFVLAMLAADDPQRAIDWLDDPSNKHVHLPKVGHQLAGTITKEWARHDPGAALEWSLTLERSQRAGAMTGLLGTISSTDPDLLDASLRRWQSVQPDEAAEWLNSRIGEQQSSRTKPRQP